MSVRKGSWPPFVKTCKTRLLLELRSFERFGWIGHRKWPHYCWREEFLSWSLFINIQITQYKNWWTWLNSGDLWEQIWTKYIPPRQESRRCMGIRRNQEENLKKCFFINEDRSSDTLIPNIKKMYNTRHNFSFGLLEGLFFYQKWGIPISYG